MKTKTYRFGRDCLGNTPNAVTVEGVCYGDIYRDESERFYNAVNGERGRVFVGEDGELHFIAKSST